MLEFFSGQSSYIVHDKIALGVYIFVLLNILWEHNISLYGQKCQSW